VLHSSILSQFLNQTFKEQAFTTKLRYELLRDMGACLEPMSAWLLLQGCMYYSLFDANQDLSYLYSGNLVPQNGATPAECNGSCKVSGEASKSGLGIISRSSFTCLSRNSEESPQRLRVYLGFRGSRGTGGRRHKGAQASLCGAECRKCPFIGINHLIILYIYNTRN